ncbi:hypothetical protein AnigIFM59636_005267 [Aspergillus niger]|nr:hypothetical protein AlacWU_03676 [Aspergillus niger]GKZ92535.1 hypothetical protein AnigIFM59636_005267 [Aspergillus niger]
MVLLAAFVAAVSATTFPVVFATFATINHLVSPRRLDLQMRMWARSHTSRVPSVTLVLPTSSVLGSVAAARARPRRAIDASKNLVLSEGVLARFHSEGIRNIPLTLGIKFTIAAHAITPRWRRNFRCQDGEKVRVVSSEYGVVTHPQSSSPDSRLVQQAEVTAVDLMRYPPKAGRRRPFQMYFKPAGLLHIPWLCCAKANGTSRWN